MNSNATHPDTLAHAIIVALEHGNALMRHGAGLWGPEGDPTTLDPNLFFSGKTVAHLVQHGRMQYTARANGETNDRYATRAEICLARGGSVAARPYRVGDIAPEVLVPAPRIQST